MDKDIRFPVSGCKSVSIWAEEDGRAKKASCDGLLGRETHPGIPGHPPLPASAFAIIARRERQPPRVLVGLATESTFRWRPARRLAAERLALVFRLPLQLPSLPFYTSLLPVCHYKKMT
jgi:hypothetical protein